MYTYNAEVVRVVDGDTVDLLVDLGLRVKVKARIRLLGINAPEMSTGAAGIASKQFLTDLCSLHPQVIVYTHKDKTDKYGRWLGDLYDAQDPASSSFSAQMVHAGFAVDYTP